MSTVFAKLTEPLMPPNRTIRHYKCADPPHDVVAGITVSVVDPPRSMAFAVIAGVNPVYGIYTVIIQAFLGGLFTSSPFLSNGPTNTQSLLVAAIARARELLGGSIDTAGLELEQEDKTIPAPSTSQD